MISHFKPEPGSPEWTIHWEKQLLLDLTDIQRQIAQANVNYKTPLV